MAGLASIALIGLFPVVDDIITTALSLFIVHEAYQLGAPGHVIARARGAGRQILSGDH